MRLPGRRSLFYSLGLAIALPLFGRQIWVSYQSVRSGDVSLVQPRYLALALLLTVTMSFIQAVGWVWLMRSMGIQLTLRECLSGFFASFLPRYIPGSVWGYVSRGAWLEQAHGVPYRLSSLGSIMEMGLFILTTALVTMGGVAVLRPEFARWMGIASVITVITTALLLPRAQRLYLCRSMPGESLPPGHRQRWVYPVLVVFLIFWLVYGAAIVATAAALGASRIRMVPASMAAGQAWIVGLLAVVVPAGLGVRETTLAGLLVSQGGLSTEAAAAIAVMSRFELLLAEIIWLLIGVTVIRLSRKKTLTA